MTAAPATRPVLVPRLCQGLSTVSAGDAIIVDGAPRRRRLSGATATSLLPRVLPLLDGSRDAARIASEVGEPPAAVIQLIDVLDECGLMEWPSGGTPVPEMAEHVTSYLSRNISHVNGYRCAADVGRALAEATVMLVGVGWAMPRIASDLLETGIVDVRIRATPGDVSAEDLGRLSSGRHKLVVVLDDGGNCLAETTTRVRGTGTPVLRCSVGEDTAETGPVFFAGWTACVGCFDRGYRDLLGDAAPVAAPDSATAERAAMSSMGAALATSEILALLAGIGSPAKPWCMTRVTGFGQVTERYDVLAEVGCQACGLPEAGVGAGPAGGALAVAYEWQHELRPAALTPPEGIVRERLRFIKELERQRDLLPPAPSRHLPASGTSDEARIAALLARTAGRRMPGAGSPAGDPGAGDPAGDAGAGDPAGDPGGGAKLDRWAPSAGNLASVQLYIATRRNIFGLPGSVFRYDDLGHRVTCVRADEIPLERLLANTDLRAAHGTGPFDLALIFVAAVARLSRKYGDFALRLAFLDAGCAALQLAVAAVDRHADVIFASAWNDELAGLLELEDDAELITAVAGLRHRPMPAAGKTGESCR